METTAKRLKQLRTDLGLSVAKFAEKLDMSPSTINGYEREERTPSELLFIQLANKLNVNLNWLVSGQGEKFINVCQNTYSFVKNDTIDVNFKNWGERLSLILAKSQITPYRFAQITGISEKRIEKIILDSIEPTIYELNAIKSNIDISIDWLLYGSIDLKNDDKLNNNTQFSNDEVLKLKKILKYLS